MLVLKDIMSEIVNYNPTSYGGKVGRVVDANVDSIWIKNDNTLERLGIDVGEFEEMFFHKVVDGWEEWRGDSKGVEFWVIVCGRYEFEGPGDYWEIRDFTYHVGCKMWRDKLIFEVIDPVRRREANRYRDSQRSRVYRAERKFKQENPKLATNPYSIDGCQLYLKTKILRAGWFPQLFPGCVGRRIPVRRTRKKTLASYAKQGEVWLTPRGQNPYTIVHEAAHVITRWEFDADEGGCVGHGPRWCGVMLLLVDKVFGYDAYRNLKREFQDAKVKFYNVNHVLLQDRLNPRAASPD